MAILLKMRQLFIVADGNKNVREHATLASMDFESYAVIVRIESYVNRLCVEPAEWNNVCIAVISGEKTRECHKIIINVHRLHSMVSRSNNEVTLPIINFIARLRNKIFDAKTCGGQAMCISYYNRQQKCQLNKHKRAIKSDRNMLHWPNGFRRSLTET